MEYTLSLVFLTETDDKFTLSISGVKENLIEENVTALMNIVLANDIFISKKGAITSKHSAKVTQRQVTAFEITK